MFAAMAPKLAAPFVIPTTPAGLPAVSSIAPPAICAPAETVPAIVPKIFEVRSPVVKLPSVVVNVTARLCVMSNPSQS